MSGLLDNNRDYVEGTMELLELVARKFYDGHYTIMKFSTGYKAMLGTPDLDSGKGRERINSIEPSRTFIDAVHAATMNALISLDRKYKEPPLKEQKIT